MVQHPNFHLAHWPKAGQVISVPIAFGLRHKGIVSDRWRDGKPMVISGSARAGRVVEETWDVFARGDQPKVDLMDGPFAGVRAVRRAREKMGSEYSLLFWNCDHLVHHAVGPTARSPQLAALLLGAALAVLLAVK